MPIDIERMFPELWVDEDEDEGKTSTRLLSFKPFSTAIAASANSRTTNSTTLPPANAWCNTSHN